MIRRCSIRIAGRTAMAMLFRNVTDELTPRRSHLRAFISADDGKTWQEGLLLDDRLNISYHDGFESKDGAKNK